LSRQDSKSDINGGSSIAYSSSKFKKAKYHSLKHSKYNLSGNGLPNDDKHNNDEIRIQYLKNSKMVIEGINLLNNEKTKVKEHSTFNKDQVQNKYREGLITTQGARDGAAQHLLQLFQGRPGLGADAGH